MKKLFLRFIAFAGLGFLLAQPALANDAQFASTLMGAGIGGLIGSSIGHGDGRLAATGAGVFLGGLIGNELGRPSYYDEPRYAAASSAYAYPYDMFPPGDSYGGGYRPNYVAPPTPVPMPVIYLDDTVGNYCREFTQMVRIGNRMQESYGTACLQPDGSWHIVQ
jgi:surface antigen